METSRVANQLAEVAFRIKEMRHICGFTEAEMAANTDTTVEQYHAYEAGLADLPFTFIHKCALAFGLVLYIAALSAQGVPLRGLFRLE